MSRFSDEEVERYARNLVLSEIGGPGQQRLKAARVLIVGVGGIGSPAALYLAAAGVGSLTLIDADTVGLSNLQRQILFDTDQIGRSKVEAGAERLTALNPHVRVELLNQWLTNENAREVVAAHDVVIDGSDSFETRFAVNEACVAGSTPLVSGALGRWSGQVAVFEGRPCYSCMVPVAPPDAETCQRVGVVGALAGVIGAMSALEAIKIITGAGHPLAGRLMLYDALTASARTVKIGADPECPVCAQEPGLKQRETL